MEEQARHKLPDSKDKAAFCRRCGVYSNFEFFVSWPKEPVIGDQRVLTCECSHCKKLTVVIEGFTGFCGEPDAFESPAQNWSVVGAWPLADGKPPDYVPEEIGELYKEAAVSLSAGCYRASAVMIRGAIDAAVSGKGATGRNLCKKIESMRGKLRDQLIEIADTLRLGGNDAAHDFSELWEQEEALELFRFLEEVLRELYETPARISRVKQIRASRPAVASTGPE